MPKQINISLDQEEVEALLRRGDADGWMLGRAETKLSEALVEGDGGEGHRVKLKFANDTWSAEAICGPDCDEPSDAEGQCCLRDWVSEAFAEILEGEIVFPVDVEWPGLEEGPSLMISGPATLNPKEGQQ